MPFEDKVELQRRIGRPCTYVTQVLTAPGTRQELVIHVISWICSNQILEDCVYTPLSGGNPRPASTAQNYWDT